MRLPFVSSDRKLMVTIGFLAAVSAIGLTISNLAESKLSEIPTTSPDPDPDLNSAR